MSRFYANIATAIWRNDDFKALHKDAQRIYLMLATQPDISAAGILSLNVTRWASRSVNDTREEVVTALQELQAARFVIFDIGTEELLVRSFVRWDKGYGNPKRRPVIKRAAQEVESEAIRRALAAEFVRLDLPQDWVGDVTPDGGSIDAMFPQVDSLSASLSGSLTGSLTGSASPPDGVVVTKALLVETSSLNPQTVQPKPSPKRTSAVPDDDPDWLKFWSAYPKKVSKKDAHRRWVTAVKKHKPEDIIAGAERYAERVKREALPASLVKNPDGWLNGERWTDEAVPADAPAYPMNGPYRAQHTLPESNAPRRYTPEQRCGEHPSYPAHNCGPCRADRLAAVGPR